MHKIFSSNTKTSYTDKNGWKLKKAYHTDYNLLIAQDIW